MRRSSKKYERDQKPLKLAAASIYPDQIHTYYVSEKQFTRSHRFIMNQKNLEDNSTQGILSRKAAKRIEHGINWLLLKAKPKRVYVPDIKRTVSFKINFVTLTLPAKQRHSDAEITAVCLNNFLNVLRKELKLENYIWRAEAQLNGNIHYHLTTDIFIHYKDLNRWWNNSVELLGYVSEFEKKFHHRQPNSTDVHAVKHVRRLAAYISQYMAKDKTFYPIGELREHKGKRFEVLYGSDQYRKEEPLRKLGKVVAVTIAGPVRKLTGRLWFCSRSISQSKPLIIQEDCFQWCSLQDVLKSEFFKVHKADYVYSYYGDVVKASGKIAPGLHDDILKHSNGLPVDLRFSDSNVLQYL